MKKHLLAIVLCLPGALVFGFYGMLAAGFGFAGSGSDFSKWWTLIGGVFFAASFGATPGLILGWYQGLRWVYPILWTAAGTFIGLIFVETFPQFSVVSALIGFIFGCRSFYRSVQTAPGVLRKPP